MVFYYFSFNKYIVNSLYVQYPFFASHCKSFLSYSLHEGLLTFCINAKRFHFVGKNAWITCIMFWFWHSDYYYMIDTVETATFHAQSSVHEYWYARSIHRWCIHTHIYKPNQFIHGKRNRSNDDEHACDCQYVHVFVCQKPSSTFTTRAISFATKKNISLDCILLYIYSSLHLYSSRALYWNN